MADPIGTTTYIEDDVESPAQRDEDLDVQSSLVQRDEDGTLHPMISLHLEGSLTDFSPRFPRVYETRLISFLHPENTREFPKRLLISSSTHVEFRSTIPPSRIRRVITGGDIKSSGHGRHQQQQP